MAQKITGYVKLQIPAGKATPAPPVGPALGQHGVNIAAFTKEFNERTKNDMGMIIPVVITVYADRSFSFITKTPPAAVLKMCIRDRYRGSRYLPGRAMTASYSLPSSGAEKVGSGQRSKGTIRRYHALRVRSVSYTHLAFAGSE